MQQPSGKTRYLALLADPVDHVKAPSFMNPAFARIGLDWFLIPLHVKPENLEAAVRGLQKIENLLGVNITIPHKAAMAAMCDELGPHAKLIGTANAVRFERGRLIGEMFDGVGLMIGQREHDIPVAGRRVLMVGAGGAGRAVAFAYAREKPRELAISNRSPARARQLVDDLQAALPALGLDAGDINIHSTGSDPSGYELVCNCTSLGIHAGDPLPLDAGKLDPGCDVVDIIAVRETELMQAAKARGCRVMGGEPMAVGQLHAFAEFFRPASQEPPA